MNGIVQRVRELVVEASNGTETASDRANAADEVDQLTDQLKQTANAQYNGNYIFSGTDTSTAPYQAGSNDAYQGNTGAVLRQVGPGTTTQVNVDLSSLLGNGQGSSDGKLLDTLRNISSDLRGGTDANTQALSTTDLSALDSNTGTLEQLQAQVGATTDGLQLATSRISATQETVTNQLDNTQDADIASYTAALKAGANIVQSSLMDFLSS
jgi:flagellar hook-associated protein 3 FlgL